MSSLIGHGLAGALASSVVSGDREFPNRRALLSLAAAIALVPDFDVVIAILLRPTGMAPHRGFSHSLLFAAILALLVAVPARLRLKLPWRTLLPALFLAAVTHPLLDFLMGAGPGIQFFAPFSRSGYLFAVRAVPTAYFGLSAASLVAVILSPRTIVGIVLECLILMPLIRAAEPPRARRRWLLLGLSAAAWLFSLFLYNRTTFALDTSERHAPVAGPRASRSLGVATGPAAMRE